MQQQRVEGHWRLELPQTETTFRVWRFTVNSSGPSSDQLEIAWRKCNETGSTVERDDQDGIHDVFSDSCAAILQPGSGPGPRSLSNDRELWVFTTSEAGARAARQNVQALLELPQIVESISPSLMVPCPQGHETCALSCRVAPQGLRLSKSAARRSQGAMALGDDAQDVLLGKVWAVLGVAALDKLVVLNGYRQSPDFTLLHVCATLSPTQDSALILSVNSRETSGRNRRMSHTSGGSLVRLLPMGYMASYVSKYVCEETQSRSMALSMAAKLRESRSVLAEWSVFWVPLSSTGINGDNLDQSEGFAAVWPDAMVEWVAVQRSQRLPVPSSVSPESSSLLASASAALFEAAWHMEPTPQSTGVIDSPQADVLGDTGDRDIAMLVADDSEDDLFSVTSSPGAEVPKSHTSAGRGSASRASTPEPLESEVVVMTQSAPQGARETAIGSITEMDFDFFDNPPSPLGEIRSPSQSIAEEQAQESPETTAVPVPTSTGENHSFSILEPREFSSEPPCEQYPSPSAAAFNPATPPSQSLFRPLELHSRLRRTRYEPNPRRVITDDSTLVERLRRHLPSRANGQPSIPAWLDQDRRQEKPRSRLPTERLATADDSQNGTSAGLPSPPASPDIALLAVADSSDLRYNGIQCISADLLDQAARGWLGFDLDICSWKSIAGANDLKLRGTSATPGAPPSPPASPETSVKHYRDMRSPFISREAIWNRHFPARNCVTFERSQEVISIISSLPRPLCLNALCLPRDNPPAKVRKRSLSHNRPRPVRFDETSLGPPKIVLGYQGDVMLASPESVSFWQELGIGPVAGDKDVDYIVVHFGDGDLALIQRVASTYESYRLGRHAPASSDHVISTSLHQWRESLVKIPKRFTVTCNTVIYVMLPKMDHSLIELASAVIGQLSSEDRDKTPVVHMIPPCLLEDRFAISGIALDVYNRIRTKGTTVDSRCRTSTSCEYQVPAFHAVPERAVDSQSSLLKLDWPAASHDILRTKSTAHCGYTWLSEEEVLIIVCVDSSGITISDTTQHLPCDAHTPTDIINRVYDFCLAFGLQDQYITICSLEPPLWTHVQAWTTLLNALESSAHHIELLCLTRDTRITGPAGTGPRPHAPSVLTSSTAQLRAEELRASVLSLPHRVAVRTALDSVSPTEKLIFPLASSILLFGATDEEREIHNIGLHVLATSVDPDYDFQSRRLAIAESYYQLSVLAALRYTGLPHRSLPLHLQAVSRIASLKHGDQ